MARLDTSTKKYIFTTPDNYIYLYHLTNSNNEPGVYLVLPSFVDMVTDQQNVNYDPSYPLGRSAPIYSFSHSGPRSVQVTFDLHRDLMTQLNGNDNKYIQEWQAANPNKDYLDFFISAIQAAALPTYAASEKLVNPPMVALRLGADIYIKGVISNSVGVTYKYPINKNNKYSFVTITFSINEVDPYDADMVAQIGSYRNISSTLDRGSYYKYKY